MKERNLVSTVWRVIFIIIMGFGLYATIIRFTRGLGASTHLSDQFPWGLWIGFDILVGVGLAAGGFVIAATVHIFQIRKYNAIARPAILTAFLGYLLVIVALMFDLGRPYRIWHPLVMGNPHSVMFEVAMCVMFYTTVLAAEFSPLLFAKFGWKKPLKVIRAVYIPLVIVGVLLSTLHQSSLGTLYVIVPDKLHPLWYTPLLPVFFFLSAVAGGLAMTIFESFMSARAFGRRLEQELLEGIARVMVVVLAVLFVVKMINLHDRGALGLVFQPTQESVMFWGEVFLGVALPMVLFMFPAVRRSQTGLFFGATLTIMGFILNRLNVAITGIARSSGVNYVPSWMEFAITISIVAVGFALFNMAVRNLEVFPKSPPEPELLPDTVAPAMQPIFQGRALLGLWVLVLAGFLFLGFSARWHSIPGSVTTSTYESGYSAPKLSDSNVIDDIEIAQHPDSPGQVIFNHSSHVDYDAPDCGRCHKDAFPMIPDMEGVQPTLGSASTAPSGGARRAIAAWLAHSSAQARSHEAAPAEDTDDGYHSVKRCGGCHNGDDAFSVEEDCEDCHME